MKTKWHLMNYTSSINVQLACWDWRWRLCLKMDPSTDEVQGVVRQVEVPGWSVDGRFWTSEACDGWVDQAESDLTSDEAEGAAVWLVVFLRNETCKSLESNCGRRTPTSTCGQDQRSKGIPCSTSRTRMLSSSRVHVFCSKHRWRM